MNSAQLRKNENETSRGQPRAARKVQKLRPAEVRQGVTLGHMRYVLGLSLALVIVAFAIIYFLYF